MNHVESDGKSFHVVGPPDDPIVWWEDDTPPLFDELEHGPESDGLQLPTPRTAGGGSSGGPKIIFDQPNTRGINRAITKEWRDWLVGITVNALTNRINDPDCNQWLQKTINKLKEENVNLLSAAITKPSDLINVVLSSSKIYIYGGSYYNRLRDTRSGSFAWSNGSGIYLGEKFHQPYLYGASKGDQVATLIHELFQVSGASRDGHNITDVELSQWVGESSWRSGLLGGWDNAVISHCGLKTP